MGDCLETPDAAGIVWRASPSDTTNSSGQQKIQKAHTQFLPPDGVADQGGLAKQERSSPETRPRSFEPRPGSATATSSADASTETVIHRKISDFEKYDIYLYTLQGVVGQVVTHSA